MAEVLQNISVNRSNATSCDSPATWREHRTVRKAVDVVPVVVQVLQSLVVLLLSPLYVSVLARAEAIVGSKRGPSVLQPYRDLAKLLRKGSAVSDQASWVFRGAPFVAFACYLTFSARAGDHERPAACRRPSSPT